MVAPPFFHKKKKKIIKAFFQKIIIKLNVREMHVKVIKQLITLIQGLNNKKKIIKKKKSPLRHAWHSVVFFLLATKFPGSFLRYLTASVLLLLTLIFFNSLQPFLLYSSSSPVSVLLWSLTSQAISILLPFSFNWVCKSLLVFILLV